MNIPKIAIEKAIEGGWYPNAHEQGINWSGIDQPWQVTICDQTFWQALGKALGWGKARAENPWPEAHRFYDLILTNQSTEQFWKNMLK